MAYGIEKQMTARAGVNERHGSAPVGIAAPMLAMDAGQRMEHRVGAAQLLLSELLVLPASDLERRVAEELDVNAALELPVVPSCQRCGHPVWRGTCMCGVRELPPQRRESGDQPDRLTRVAAQVRPRELLLTEAARTLGAAQRVIAAHLLADIDDLGLLAEPVTAVAARLRVGPATVHRVIEALRASGAPGLCAESLTERLRLQVSAAANDLPVPPEVEALVARGLGPLAGGDLKGSAAACGLRPEQVRSAVSWIRGHIEADAFGVDEPVAPVPVDAVIRRDGDRLIVDVVPGPWSALHIAESYLAVAADPLVHRDIARARRFIDVLDRRTHTMLRVLQDVIIRQSRRVIEGPRAHHPLRRRDVAAELGLHESTVSRAVAGKHLRLPSGETVTFSALFGPALGVQQCLRDLVTGETIARSDAELVRELAAQGHHVARRTVAKYRAELGIPSQRVR
ncbi:MAG: hypothetical protein ACRDS0_03565 [Pseudonocardiaceae bacterium]